MLTNNHIFRSVLQIMSDEDNILTFVSLTNMLRLRRRRRHRPRKLQITSLIFSQQQLREDNGKQCSIFFFSFRIQCSWRMSSPIFYPFALNLPSIIQNILFSRLHRKPARLCWQERVTVYDQQKSGSFCCYSPIQTAPNGTYMVMGARRLPSPNIFHVCLFFFTSFFPQGFMQERSDEGRISDILLFLRFSTTGQQKQLMEEQMICF